MALSNFKVIANAKIERFDIKTSISFYQNKVISKAFFLKLLLDYIKSAVRLSLTVKHVSKPFYFLFSGQRNMTAL